MSMKYCCCELKTGVFITGILFTVVTSISLLTEIILLSSKDDDVEEPVDARTSAHTHAANLVSSLLGVGVNVSLLYGVIKDKRLFFVPWLALYAIGFGILTIIFIICIFIEPLFLLLLLLLVPFWYAWYCVWQYYRSMDENNLNHTIQTTKDYNSVTQFQQEVQQP